MSKPKHTPGPWGHFPNGIGTQDTAPKIVHLGDELEIVALVPRDGNLMYEQDHVANAHLIAAAPDLLAALELAVRHGVIQADTYTGSVAHRAIAKARGES